MRLLNRSAPSPLPPKARRTGARPSLLLPVADGRTVAYEYNVEKTWRMVERVYNLITSRVKLPDGTPVRVVVAPEIVYGARTGALCSGVLHTRGSFCKYLGEPLMGIPAMS